MRQAVVGARVHSGWAALVTVSGTPDAPEVVDRRRIEFIDLRIAGAKQPFHYVETFTPAKAEKHIERCRQSSSSLAADAVAAAIDDLAAGGFQASACVILHAAGRPLPALPEILTSHALIHTAEGEFFRRIVRDAAENHGLAVTGIREKDLDRRAGDELGMAPNGIQERILNLGRALGPPWSQDQRLAMLAAWVVLSGLGSAGQPL